MAVLVSVGVFRGWFCTASNHLGTLFPNLKIISTSQLLTQSLWAQKKRKNRPRELVMADPFSIASGTVGIISLGIQLCKEITTYVDSWRGYDADLESIGWKAESLKEPLKQLRDFVEDSRVTDTNTANDITDKASELERHLRRLEKRLTQAKPVISRSLTDKFRNKLKKAAYPVRARDALRDIKDDLDSIKSIIEFSLAIFTAKRILKASQSTERKLKLVEEIHLTLSTIPQNIMLPPSVLKSLCDRRDEHANLADLDSQFNSTTQGDDFDLDIDARLSSMTLSTKHARRQDSAKRIFRYYSGWLARQITLSFSLSYAAGAFSIAPVLVVQAYRGPGSWVDHAVPGRRLRKIMMMQDPDSRQESENELIGDFQQAISTGKFGPGDLREDGDSVVQWIVYSVNADERSLIEKRPPGPKLEPELIMDELLNAQWRADDYIFALYLIDHGALVKALPKTRCGKENIKKLLRRDRELVDLPDIAKIILLESELELREALQSGNTNLTNGPNGHPSLLELAVGWPSGVQVLLEFGAEASKVILRACPYKTLDTYDSDSDDYCDSIMPLLQGGCIFEANDVYMCESKKARLLLIDEYANRRKNLLDMARQCLPLERLAEILGNFSSESIIDVHAPQICTELINNGRPVHRSMRYELKDYQPLYHSFYYDVDFWDDLYRAGFRDIDSPNSQTTIERDHSFIRFLTFEALGLRHTCCIGIDDAFHARYEFSAMDREEVQNIQDEDKHRYKQLDQLVEKFDTWFDELELPIMEFLSGPWHSHIVEVLSTRDSYDEEHVRQSRDLGIFLEPADVDEAPKFFYLLGHQVEELESVNSDCADVDSDGDYWDDD
ncbi:hypothetical protein N7452_011444 [Penicillium brevicompactum]|uniref:Fungal N-terminal domain-containing protein n=1 Tax=Penicillium brevicompactum TaxID=5074 RepID=A0A9W9Q272_PENBR|nr:hypothetical protein N7452_011444 [Penicillium brevicompactum]